MGRSIAEFSRVANANERLPERRRNIVRLASDDFSQTILRRHVPQPGKRHSEDAGRTAHTGTAADKNLLSLDKIRGHVDRSFERV